jgi:hypothetical protein
MHSQTKVCIAKLSSVDERENTALQMVTDRIFFFGLCPPSNSLKTHSVSEAGRVSVSGKEALNLAGSLD